MIRTQETTEAEVAEEFRRRWQDPREWTASAERLLRAARLVWGALAAGWSAEAAALTKDDKASSVLASGDTTLTAPAMLLLGHALESYLKALIVSKRFEGIASTDKVRHQQSCRKTVGGHDLPDLALRANFGLSEPEEYLLERLTLFVTWGGTYPSPLKPKDYDNRVLVGTDKDCVLDLVNRIRILLANDVSPNEADRGGS